VDCWPDDMSSSIFREKTYAFCNARHVHFSLKFFFTYYVDQRGPTDGCVLGEMVMECCMQSNFVYRSSDFSESRLNFRGATVSI
jgi:hypothetical protein